MSYTCCVDVRPSGRHGDGKVGSGSLEVQVRSSTIAAIGEMQCAQGLVIVGISSL